MTETYEKIVEEINVMIDQYGAKVESCRRSSHINKMIYFNGIIAGLELAKAITGENVGGEKDELEKLNR